jgi:hypothetical protein
MPFEISTYTMCHKTTPLFKPTIFALLYGRLLHMYDCYFSFTHVKHPSPLQLQLNNKQSIRH